MATTAAACRRLLCVAPLVPAGGVDTLLTAFGMLADDRPDLTVDVVGRGPLSRVLRAHAAYLGVAGRVDFRGSLSAPAVRAAVRGCAVLVLPHRDGRAAAAPTVEVALLAALASACPVVATPHATPDSALPDTELVVPPDVPTVLAQALETALDARGPADPRGVRDGADHDGHLLRRAWLRVVR
jgi:glycosyltransferase involved in cell wall biosynthesis